MTAQETHAGAFTEDGEVYPHLERRPHPWRKQPYVKGRNLTVGRLVRNMRANDHSVESAAEDYDLPVEQIREALRYYERHREVVEQDQAEERRLLVAAGIMRDDP